MNQSLFSISQMDCPSEENLIRMHLSNIGGIQHLDFDLAKRELKVYHTGEVQPIASALSKLSLGSKHLSTVNSEFTVFEESSGQRQLLWTVLAVNFIFFIIEIITGLLYKSIGLVADSLDMLADSFVYAISLVAVGKSVVKKKTIATIAGYFQILLALVGFGEVLRRFFGTEQLPNFSAMIMVSIFALIANGYCLYLFQKSKSKEEAHMKASMIFTSNDVIINIGVITAGLLVFWLESNKPDLIVGTIVFVVVIIGALKILKLGR
jgi:Co/Zn/Cd efflux system component